MDGGDSDRKVFVSNLPFTIDWQALKTTFRKAGNVTYAHVMKDTATGKSKGCGIVEFETAAGAEAAIDMFESFEMGGRTVHVRRDIQDAGARQQAIAAKRAATDQGDGGFGSKRSRVEFEGGNGADYARGMDAYDTSAQGFLGRGQADFPLGQSAAASRGAGAVAALDGGIGMGMGMGMARRARAAGLYGDVYGGMEAAARGMGLGLGMSGGGMAGLGAAGLMGAAGLAAGMASLEAMAAYAGYAGRAREMFEPPMGGFEPGFDPNMAGAFGDGGYGGYGRGPMGPGPGFGPQDMGAMVGRRVFVTNLNFQTTWQEVKDHFKSVGNVTYVTLLKDKEGKSKGCAIVELETPEDAMRSINELSNSELRGRRITVREDQMAPGMGPGAGMTHPAPEMQRGTGGGGRGADFSTPAPPGAVQLVVHGLPFSYDWVQLRDMMKASGKICKVDIKKDQSGRSKGWATVQFEDDVSAQKAIDMFHGSLLQGRTIQVQKDRFIKGGAPDTA